MPPGGIEPPLRDPQSRVLSVERQGQTKIFEEFPFSQIPDGIYLRARPRCTHFLLCRNSHDTPAFESHHIALWLPPSGGRHSACGDDARNFEPKVRLRFEDLDKSIQKLRAIYKVHPEWFEIPKPKPGRGKNEVNYSIEA